MKKIILILTIIVAMTGYAMAEKYSTTNVRELPAAAQTFLKQNFKKKVHHIKVERKTFGSNEYEVILTDGTEVEFDGNGAWKSIDCGLNSVPSNVIPTAINTFLSKNYKGTKVVEIELDRKGFEVKLSNGLELKFDRSGNFIRIDD